jgi:hypothetical protein
LRALEPGPVSYPVEVFSQWRDHRDRLDEATDVGDAHGEFEN